MTCQSCGVGDEGAGSGKPRCKTFVLVLYMYYLHVVFAWDGEILVLETRRADNLSR